MPHQSVDPGIWVDASSGWGIGIVYDDLLYAWSLAPGWKAYGRDIGWAKSIAP